MNMKKNDVMLLLIIVISAFMIFGMRFALKDQGKAYVTVRIDGEIVDTFPLSEDREYVTSSGGNHISIKNGLVDMIEADCPDQLCVHQIAVSKNNESIICLPNEVVVQITSYDEAQYDAVTN